MHWKAASHEHRRTTHPLSFRLAKTYWKGWSWPWKKCANDCGESTAALEAAGIPYAVIGGNAVAAWVSKVDPGAARNTVDVDIMVNRADFDAVKTALANAGFHHLRVAGRRTCFSTARTAGRAMRCIFCLQAKRCGRNTPQPRPTWRRSNQHEAHKLLALRTAGGDEADLVSPTRIAVHLLRHDRSRPA